MVDKKNKIPKRSGEHGISTGDDVGAFLRQVATAPPPVNKSGSRGRLIFAMDATASRQPSWDRAATIQGQMFHETAALGGLDIQLVFYRGFGEFKASRWTNKEADLQTWMTSVQCRAGETQLSKVLAHTANETAQNRVNALVFVGDCCEEDVDHIGVKAGELGLKGVPAFMFHEGNDDVAAFAFREVARLTRGAYCHFDASSAAALRDLLAAVAVYAAGGRMALENLAEQQGGAVLQIANQMKGNPS
ncbi:MAG: VWA domain-containing protein [Rhodospirillales bacterium]|nr:VWA domain-containing protein [Rhodospirillales bacterium]